MSNQFPPNPPALNNILLQGFSSGQLLISVPPSVTSYEIFLPSSQASGACVLENDGLGNLSWVPSGSVTGITGVGPFSSSSQPNGASVSGHNLIFGPADSTNPGMIKASGAQSLNALLTFLQPISGSTLAGDNDGSGTPGVGNLYLESTTNVKKGYVGITDGSVLNIGPQTFVDTAIANEGASPSAGLYVAIDKQGTLVANDVNDILFEAWGGATQIQFVGTGGTSSALAFVANGQPLGQVGFGEWNTGSSPSANVKYNAFIEVIATETRTGSNFGSAFDIQLIKNGTSSRKRVWQLNGDGSINMGGTSAFSSGVNQLWSVDGAGNIGASGANRPNQLYVKDIINIGTSPFTSSQDGISMMGSNTNNEVFIGSSTSGGSGGFASVGFASNVNSAGNSNPSQVAWAQSGDTLDSVFQISTSSPSTFNAWLMLQASPLAVVMDPFNDGCPLLWKIDGSSSIGASGANRPLDLFTNRHVVVGQNLSRSLFYSTSTNASDTIPSGFDYYILEPVATQTTKTTIMPAAPLDGEVLTIAGGNVTGGVVTTWTLQANTSQTLNNPPTTLPANTAYSWFWRAANTTWYRLQ